MTVYSLDELFPSLALVCSSMSSSELLDLNIDFSGGRSGGLILPSLEEFSTVCCDTRKDFGIVNKSEVDICLELSCFFDYPTDVGHLISGSSAFSKSA